MISPLIALGVVALAMVPGPISAVAPDCLRAASYV